MNILLVDDEPFMLEQLEYLIKPLIPLSHIYTAMDTSQALQLSNKVNFQLIFLDIELPGKSGLEIAAELKKQNKDLNIIILTAHQDFEYAKMAIKIGVSDYLTKPIIEHEFKELLAQYIKANHQKEYSKMIRDTILYVHEHYGDRLNLSQAAKTIHVNPSYLSRKFSEEVGLSFSEYLTNYRIEMAKTLLLTHMDYSISEIATITGFNSLHYFSNIFRKNVNMTPKQYREMGEL